MRKIRTLFKTRRLDASQRRKVSRPTLSLRLLRMRLSLQSLRRYSKSCALTWIEYEKADLVIPYRLLIPSMLFWSNIGGLIVHYTLPAGSSNLLTVLVLHLIYPCTRTARQQLDLEYDPFDQVLKVFSSAQVDGIEPKQPRSLYEYSASFFSHMADAIRLVRSGKNDSLCLELVLGDAFVIMDQVLPLMSHRDGSLCVNGILKHRSNTRPFLEDMVSRSYSIESTSPTFQITCKYCNAHPVFFCS